MRFNFRLFVILLLAGLAGVLSVLLVDLNGLIAILPIPERTEMPVITPALKVLSLIQPTILLAVAVLVGVALASKVGLSSPVAEALASGGDTWAAFKPQIIPVCYRVVFLPLTLVSSRSASSCIIAALSKTHAKLRRI